MSGHIKNEKDNYIEFCECLRQFIIGVCQFFKTSGVPIRTWFHIVRKEGHTEFPSEERLNFSSAISEFTYMLIYEEIDYVERILDCIRRQPELLSYFITDGIGNPVAEQSIQRRFAINKLDKDCKVQMKNCGLGIIWMNK